MLEDNCYYVLLGRYFLELILEELPTESVWNYEISVIIFCQLIYYIFFGLLILIYVRRGSLILSFSFLPTLDFSWDFLFKYFHHKKQLSETIEYSTEGISPPSPHLRGTLGKEG